MIFRKLVVLVAIGASLTPSSEAAIVTLSGSRVGPILETSDGFIASNSLILVGTLTGTPASSSVTDISAVFDIFASTSSSHLGSPNTTLLNYDSGVHSFDGLKIYVWAFNSATMATATQHGLFTNPNAPPSVGDDWIFPVHLANGQDSATLSLLSLYTEGDATFTPGVQFTAATNRITLTPIPEPSGALLLGLSLALFAIRRR